MYKNSKFTFAALTSLALSLTFCFSTSQAEELSITKIISLAAFRSGELELRLDALNESTIRLTARLPTGSKFKYSDIEQPARFVLDQVQTKSGVRCSPDCFPEGLPPIF